MTTRPSPGRFRQGVAPLAIAVAVVFGATGALLVRPGETTLVAVADAAAPDVTAGTDPQPPLGAAPAPAPRPQRVLLVGDSVAATLASGLEAVLAPLGVELHDRARLGCGISVGGTVDFGGAPSVSRCDSVPDELAAATAEVDPDVVVLLSGGWDQLDRLIDGRWHRVGTPEHDAYFLATVEATVGILSAGGADVLVLTNAYFEEPREPPPGGHWAESDLWRIDRLNALYRLYADAHPETVRVVELGAEVTPDGPSSDVRQGVSLRYDGRHFSTEGARVTGEWLAPELARALRTRRFEAATAALAARGPVAASVVVATGSDDP